MKNLHRMHTVVKHMIFRYTPTTSDENAKQISDMGEKSVYKDVHCGAGRI